MAPSRSVSPLVWLVASALWLVPALARADEPALPALPALPTADQATALLTAGNQRFVLGTSTHPRQDDKRRGEFAAGQHPFVTVLSCSDSRSPVEVLFDEGLGDVFSVRVAGNVANGDEMGSIEYGVEHLGTPLLVVMGHTKCGAVTAVAKHSEVHGHIPALVAKIGPSVEAVRAREPAASEVDLIAHSTNENVFQAMATILRESEAVRARVESKKVRMVGALYDVNSGAVTWLGPHPEEARLVKEHAPAPREEPPQAATAPSAAPPPPPPAPPSAPAPGGGGPLAFILVGLACSVGGVLVGRRTK